MNVGNSNTNPELPSMDELAEEFLSRQKSDHPPSIADYIRQYPLLENEIRELFPTIVQMENLRHGKLTRRSDGRVETGPKKIQQLGGDYTILREIGRGGMGVIYLAHQKSLDREVAIKILPERVLGEKRLKDFMQEARLAAKLHHTNIVPIFEVGEQKGTYYYVMQVIAGESLDNVIRHTTEPAARKMTPENLARIGQQVASALHYAHEQGTLHRDIKPANLILDPNDNTWVTDFGLAIAEKNSNQKIEVESGQSAQVSGTLQYMPPERLKGRYDRKSEVWCLGVTLIDVAAGRITFSGRDDNAVLKKIMQGTDSALQQLESVLPRDLIAILRKATSTKVDKRYQTAKQMAEDFSKFRSGHSVSARKYSRFDLLTTWARRKPALATMTALVAASLLAITVLTSFGYLRINRILDSESRHLARAENSTRVAEHVMDEIFLRFNPDSVFVTDNPANYNPDIAQPMLSIEAADTLEELSRYYEQLSDGKTNGSEYGLKAALAAGKVGEIYERLGDYKGAANAYQKSLERIRILPPSVFDRNQIIVARLLNQLGEVLEVSGDQSGSKLAHNSAIHFLDRELGHDQQIVRLEKARSHYLLSRRVRPGKGINSLPPPQSSPLSSLDNSLRPYNPDRIENIETAISLLTDGLSLDLPDNLRDSYKLLLAQCYRESAHDYFLMRSSSDFAAEEESICLLEDLIASSTGNKKQNLIYELHETLSEVHVFGFIPKDHLETVLRNLKRAVDLVDSLVSKRPDIAEYRRGYIHTNFKLASLNLVRLDRDPEQAGSKALFNKIKERVQNSIRMQRRLCVSDTRDKAGNIWLVRFILFQSWLESKHGSMETAIRLTAEADTILKNNTFASGEETTELMRQEIKKLQSSFNSR